MAETLTAPAPTIRVHRIGSFTEDQAFEISEMVRAYPALAASQDRRMLHQRLTDAIGCTPSDTLNAAAKIDKTYRIWRARHRAPMRA